MAKRRKPGRPGANPADGPDINIPGEKKQPGRAERLAQQLRGNLNKRKAQSRTRHSPRGK
ncbi:MAG: hypothetical protein ISR51_03490 [Rhodospirillales bacterium]|nr:hypothetical protein [Alphaproteobacteria bacterium]MBL6947717.1 hypothetical protein [Rhodospirillales bacterium]